MKKLIKSFLPTSMKKHDRKMLLPIAILFVFVMSVGSFAASLTVGAPAKQNSDADECACSCLLQV